LWETQPLRANPHLFDCLFNRQQDSDFLAKFEPGTY
jgi:hypothetical protein